MLYQMREGLVIYEDEDRAGLKAGDFRSFPRLGPPFQVDIGGFVC